MVRAPLPVFLLSLCALLAGCADNAPAPNESVASADSASTNVLAEASPEPSPAPEPVTVVCTITRTNLGTTTGYGLNIDRVVAGIDECLLETLFNGNTSWANAGLVEATWTTQTTQTGTDLYLESEICQPTLPPAPCDLPHVMGATSPLRLEMTADHLRAVEGNNPSVMVSGQGLVMDLEYTLHITLFPAAIPEGFTGIV